ncbi:SigB/SigF/SigG family RNA polymerase sigma factor [Virgisporangium aliadipatigenens]|nr:SigB/SigF/SigG family RNA polymerase sigma factor [Virgisporangium aliadipatigenens]
MTFPSFMLRVHRWDSLAVVDVDGVVDLATVPLLRAALHELTPHFTSVVIDLADVPLLDGHSVGVLVSTHRRARKHGHDVRLRSAQGRVLRVLEISGADKLCDDDTPVPHTDGEDCTSDTLLRARARADEQYRDTLREMAVAASYELASALARSYRGRGESVDDLIQVAMVGLLKAVNGFDPEHGSGFRAYAVPTIVGEIKRHFRDKGWMLRVPRRMQEIGMELAGARDVLAQRLGRAPTISEIAEQLRLTREEVAAALDAAQVYRPGSLSAPVGGEGDGELVLGDLVGGIDDGFELVENRESLRGLLGRLPSREQRILALRFYGNRTQAQIAEEVGISQMHVSRLLTGALRRLRDGLTGC